MNIFLFLSKYSKKIIIKIHHAKSKIWKEIIYLFTLKNSHPKYVPHDISCCMHMNTFPRSRSPFILLIFFYPAHQSSSCAMSCPVHTFQSKVCLPKYNCKNYDNNNDTIIFQQYKSNPQSSCVHFNTIAQRYSCQNHLFYLKQTIQFFSPKKICIKLLL